jgi:nitric oxide reductase NorD protein
MRFASPTGIYSGRAAAASRTSRPCTRRICRAAVPTRRGSRIRRSRRTDSNRRRRPAPSSRTSAKRRARRRAKGRRAPRRATSRTAASARRSPAMGEQRAARQQLASAESARGNQAGGEKGVPYPEWDYRESRYKRNWSWVQEKRLGESNMAETNRLMKQYSNALKRLKKAIQSQKPTPHGAAGPADGRRRHGPQRGGELRRRARGGPLAQAREIYKRREIRQREVAVTLLADMSTSIMQHLPRAAGGWSTACAPACCCSPKAWRRWATLFDRRLLLQVPRQRQLLPIKDFDEPLSTETCAADRRHVGAARHAHGRGDPPRHTALRRVSRAGGGCCSSCPTGAPRTTTTAATGATCTRTRGWR